MIILIYDLGNRASRELIERSRDALDALELN
jgi:hypothetical protein